MSRLRSLDRSDVAKNRIRINDISKGRFVQGVQITTHGDVLSLSAIEQVLPKVIWEERVATHVDPIYYTHPSTDLTHHPKRHPDPISRFASVHFPDRHRQTETWDRRQIVRRALTFYYNSERRGNHTCLLTNVNTAEYCICLSSSSSSPSTARFLL